MYIKLLISTPSFKIKGTLKENAFPGNKNV